MGGLKLLLPLKYGLISDEGVHLRFVLGRVLEVFRAIGLAAPSNRNFLNGSDKIIVTNEDTRAASRLTEEVSVVNQCPCFH